MAFMKKLFHRDSSSSSSTEAKDALKKLEAEQALVKQQEEELERHYAKQCIYEPLHSVSTTQTANTFDSGVTARSSDQSAADKRADFLRAQKKQDTRIFGHRMGTEGVMVNGNLLL